MHVLDDGSTRARGRQQKRMRRTRLAPHRPAGRAMAHCASVAAAAAAGGPAEPGGDVLRPASLQVRTRGRSPLTDPRSPTQRRWRPRYGTLSLERPEHRQCPRLEGRRSEISTEVSTGAGLAALQLTGTTADAADDARERLRFLSDLRLTEAAGNLLALSGGCGPSVGGAVDRAARARRAAGCRAAYGVAAPAGHPLSGSVTTSTFPLLDYSELTVELRGPPPDQPSSSRPWATGPRRG